MRLAVAELTTGPAALLHHSLLLDRVRTVLGSPYRRACSSATLREVTSSVSANGGEALCGVSFSQVAADARA